MEMPVSYRLCTRDCITDIWLHSYGVLLYFINYIPLLVIFRLGFHKRSSNVLSKSVFAVEFVVFQMVS